MKWYKYNSPPICQLCILRISRHLIKVLDTITYHIYNKGVSWFVLWETPLFVVIPNIYTNTYLCVCARDAGKFCHKLKLYTVPTDLNVRRKMFSVTICITQGYVSYTSSETHMRHNPWSYMLCPLLRTLCPYIIDCE